MKAQLRAAPAPEPRPLAQDEATTPGPGADARGSGRAATAEAAPAAPLARHQIESFREARLRGWGLGPGGAPSALRVLAGGVSLPVIVRRLDRPDVLRAHPGVPSQPIGFAAEIDPAAWRQADARGRVALQPEIDGRPVGAPVVLDAKALAAWCHALAGWRRPDERETWRLLAHVAASGQLARLPRRASAWIAAAADARGLGPALQAGDPGARIALGARLHLRVDRRGALEIEGWALDPGGEAPLFTLACNGRRVACEPGWTERADLQRALHASQARLGFRVEVPPAVWAHADAEGACAIRVEAQGRTVLETDLRLDAPALREERAALEGLAREHEPGRRAHARRRLALLCAHAEALPSRAGWTPDDASALAALVAAFDAPRAGAGAADATSPGAGDEPALPAPGLRAHLEGWEQLILHGWALDVEAGGEIFTLECNGHALECFVSRTSRVDVSRALGVANEFPGFEIQLPASVWRLADADGVCRLTLRVNGRPVGPAPLLLDGAALERAVATVLPAEGERVPALAKAAGMRLRLTAVPLLMQHIEASGGAERLSPAARSRLHGVAAQLALGELLGAEASPRGATEAALENTTRRRRVWRLQRLLNAMIGRRGGIGPGVLDASLAEVLADPDATGAVRAELLMSITPLCCGDPAFERVARELPAELLAYHAEVGDNWARSLRLAFLAHAQDAAGAAAELERIAEAPASGWINTECVAFAVRAAIGGSRIDAAGLRERAAVVRAFLRLLDALPGDAWSRLQDRELVDAGAALLAADGPWPDDLADELVRTVLRCHALVPRFWSRLGDGAVGLAADERVREARADFESARDVLRALEVSPALPAPLPALLERLHARAARGQRDAMQWMRELVQAALAGGTHDAEGRPDAAREHLLRRLPELFDGDELARFALLPGIATTPRPVPTADLERRVEADRARIAAAPASVLVDASLAAAFERLARMLPALCTPETGFRGRRALEETLRDADRLGIQGPVRQALEATSARAGGAGLEPDPASTAASAGATATPTPGAPRGPDAVDAPSLWPTTAPPEPARARGGNRLRLVSPADRLRRLADARVIVVCVVRNERAMLPHFLAHHRALGAAHFVVVDNLSDDGTREFLHDQPDVVLYSADTDYRDSHYGVAWQQAVLAAHGAGRWALVLDADEMLMWPGCEHESLPELLDRLDAAGHDAARTLMIDLYPRGPLREVDFERAAPAAAAGWFDRAPLLRWHIGGGLYSNAPTWLSALRHRLIPGSPPNAFTAQKIALFRWRPWMRLSEGLHYATGLAPAPAPLFLGHYKYHAGFRAKVLLEVERKQHFDAASEYVHYLHMVAEPDASLFDPAVSVPLTDSRALPDPEAPAA